MSLSSFIARVGVSPNWIAFNAHCWFAYAVCATFPSAFIMIYGLALAAMKEFWFDATYEFPKQTFRDNLEDFLGYACGIGLALLSRIYL